MPIEMESPVIAKKVWSLVRVMFCMLRKGILKKKFLVDLSMMMKRGKIAGKALQNLMFHHHPIWTWSLSTSSSRRSRELSFPSQPAGEYEFSCSNTPSYPLSFFSSNRNKKRNFPAIPEDEMVVNADMMKALEMLQCYSEAASPAWPGFGKSPKVRQLRITDSPFPLRDASEEDSKVDKDAEEFIRKFYEELSLQSR